MRAPDMTSSRNGRRAGAARGTAGNEGGRGKENGKPLLLAAFAIVASAALAFQLMGTGVVVHFLLLVCYGAVFLSLGAFLVRPLPRPDATSSALGDNVTTIYPAPPGSGVSADSVTGRSGNDGRAVRPTAATVVVSNGEGSNVASSASSMRSSSCSTTPSPLNWVGETVGGSISWLRGSQGIWSSHKSVDSSRTLGRRRRSMSTGTAVLGVEGGEGGDGSNATTPPDEAADAAAVGGVAFGASNASSWRRGAAPDSLFGAMPALGAGILQGQNARAHVHSRNFGPGGGQGSGVGGGGLGSGVFNGDGSRGSEDDGQRSRRGDWMIGMGEERCAALLCVTLRCVA